MQHVISNRPLDVRRKTSFRTTFSIFGSSKLLFTVSIERCLSGWRGCNDWLTGLLSFQAFLRRHRSTSPVYSWLLADLICQLETRRFYGAISLFSAKIPIQIVPPFRAEGTRKRHDSNYLVNVKLAGTIRSKACRSIFKASYLRADGWKLDDCDFTKKKENVV